MPLKKCILLTSNIQNIQHAEFVAWQLKSPHTPEIFIGIGENFYLVEDRGLANIFEIHGCDEFDALPSSERLMRFTYWRIPAIDQLAETYDRILYLDTDLVISSESAIALLSIDLKDMKLAAVRDVHQSIETDRKVAEFSTIGLENAAYFNAGVLIIDGKKWREAGALNRILEIGRKYPAAMKTHDQSLLNIYAYKNWLEISPIWNWQISSRNTYLIEKFNAQVLHFIGKNKLWSSNPKSKYVCKYRDQYRKFLHDVYQQNAEPTSALQPLLAAHLWIKSLYYKNKYKHWCRKFPNPLHGILRDGSN